jgi:primosomal protein N' (replication factor Y)
LSPAYVKVAVPVPLNRLYTYGCPDGMHVEPGVRVKVPFGRRTVVGIVVGLTDELDPDLPASKVKPLSRVLDAKPVLGEDIMVLCQWLCDYYHAPPGEAFFTPLPPQMTGDRKGEVDTRVFKEEEVVRFARELAEGERIGKKMDQAYSWLRVAGEASVRELQAATSVQRDAVIRLRERGLITMTRREVLRDPFKHLSIEPDVRPELTQEQVVSVNSVAEQLGEFQGFLLHGVTGSGKTEVYLALIEQVLAQGKGALVLVPEIALTPQLVSRFRARLGDTVAVQHSGLDPAARREQWVRIARGDLRVVIWARSALFSPIDNLGIIVVDEEHEPSYKQDVSPRYQARDLALVRGRITSSPVVMGSATPSLEAWANVKRHKLKRLVLSQRVQARPMPEVSIVDMREAAVVDEQAILSTVLVDAIAETLERDEQVILFLNRRGYASWINCATCGESLQCDSCSVSFTWHKRRKRLVCHYCDEVASLPSSCPNCKHGELAEKGAGTEQVENQLNTYFRDARIARMDRDTTRGHALASLLTRFRERDIDILVGTQMVAKGHDFPNVTLVGVLFAEQSLGFPDFRAPERTFQLLTQIAGRAGRAEKLGRVIVQTRMPEHYALKHALTHDSEGFLEAELVRRENRRFPPFTYLALIRVAGENEMEARKTAEDAHSVLCGHAEHALGQVEYFKLIGPRPAPVERARNRFRFQILIKSSRRSTLNQILKNAAGELEGARTKPDIRLSVDVDPVNFL